jgi:hypothetical protein
MNVAWLPDAETAFPPESTSAASTTAAMPTVHRAHPCDKLTTIVTTSV